MTSAELNALAATKVMGWRDNHCEEFYCTPRCQLGFKSNWRPAEDIACAWVLVKKLRADGWKLHIRDDASLPHTVYEFFKLRPRSPVGIAYTDGDDALGITKAALRAVGQEVA